MLLLCSERAVLPERNIDRDGATCAAYTRDVLIEVPCTVPRLVAFAKVDPVVFSRDEGVEGQPKPRSVLPKPPRADVELLWTVELPTPVVLSSK